MALLFYYGLSLSGEDMKPLLEEYGLREKLDTTLLFDKSHEDLYMERNAWAAHVLTHTPRFGLEAYAANANS